MSGNVCQNVECDASTHCEPLARVCGGYVDYDELANLRAENARLRYALMPFAILADVKFCGEWREDESVMYTDIAHKFTFGLIRAAKEALK